MASDAPEDATIRAATPADAGSLAGIYNHYVANTIVTFEEEVVPASEMARRVEEVRSVSLPWLCAEHRGQVVGYAYAGRWHRRSAYRFAAEITVYLDPAHARRGLGSSLYGRLFPMLRERRVHAVIGGIALPNAASVALHEKFGLEKVAHFKEVGFKFERWIDGGYWHRTL